jgi:hypothetical protein
MRVTFPSAPRRVAAVAALVLLTSATALPASAQSGPAYYTGGPVYGSGMYPYGYGSGMYPYGAPYYGSSNNFWNGASHWMYENNPRRHANVNANTNTDFGYDTIPHTPFGDGPTTEREPSETTEGRMYTYNFTGGVGPVYERSELRDQHCFPC